MGELRIALQSLKMSIHSRLQYRADSIVAALAVFFARVHEYYCDLSGIVKV